MAASPAFAHTEAALTEQTAWSAWELTPDVVILSALAVLFYGVGVARRRAFSEPEIWRHLMYFGGVGAVFLSLASPIDPIAEHLFFVHQIQHLWLRMIGPMLIALSWPQAILAAGLRATFGRNLLKPIASHSTVGHVFHVLGDPVVATILFVAALYAWEVPAYHDFAQLNEPVHYLMHVTMLLAGLLFWWRVFDRRPAPQGLRYGVRLMMLWLATISNIVLGAYTVLKAPVLYHAYEVTGRLFGFAALADEQIGGIIIWIPGSMMCLVAVLIVIHSWGEHETTVAERNAALPGPDITAATLIAETRPKNRALAVGLVLFVAIVFTSAFAAGIMASFAPGKGKLTAAGATPVRHAMHDGAASVVQ